jgi:Uma2 family endonuclease
LTSCELFWAQYGDKSYELIRGKVVESALKSVLHGIVLVRISALLYAFAGKNRSGEVVVRTAFQLGHNTILGPDCAFVNTAQAQSIANRDQYVPFAPDLAVEVVSPGDTAFDIRDKVDLYRAAGTRLIWVIYPSSRKVDVYLSDGTAREISEGNALDGGEVLPGLHIPVEALFPSA